MGCVSSHLLNQEEDFTQISHHIVSLTSTTYGLLTLDPSSSPTTIPPTPTSRFTLGSILHTPLTEPIITQPPLEVIDSLELMAGLENTPQPSPLVVNTPHIFQESPNPVHNYRVFTNTKPGFSKPGFPDGLKENPNPDHKSPVFIRPGSCKRVLLDGFEENANPDQKNRAFAKPGSCKRVFLDGLKENENPDKNRVYVKPGSGKPVLLDGFQENGKNKNRVFIKPGSYKPVFLEGFEELCPPKGENRVVIYTTSLRGVRKTFEACNAVRAVLEGFGVTYCERDISMDCGFKEELRELMKGKDKHELVPPRVFVKGRYVGGSDEVLRIVEEGCLGTLLEGLPKAKVGYVCEVCGGARFLPCVVCNGSCKLVVLKKGMGLGESVSVKCNDCNENGLVCCPICS